MHVLHLQKLKDGEEVLARWTDCRYYPAKIESVNKEGESRFNVYNILNNFNIISCFVYIYYVLFIDQIVGGFVTQWFSTVSPHCKESRV